MISADALWSALRAALPADIAERYASTPGAAGLEYVDAALAVGVLASRATDEGAGAAYLLSAPRGEHATGTVTIGVSYVALFDLRLRSGAEVQTADGRRYLTTTDAVFLAPGFAAQTIPARGVRYGQTFDLAAANLVTAFVRGSWVREDTGDAVSAPTTVAVLASSPFTGGQFPLLELLAASHGADAAIGEDPETLRERAWRAPSAITKPQLEELGTRVLWATAPPAAAPYAPAEILEPADVGFAWDDDWAWDDDTGADSVWTGPAPWFILVMPETLVAGGAAAWDDDRAWDDDWAWDDADATRDALYFATFDAVRRAAAAGVLVFGSIGGL